MTILKSIITFLFPDKKLKQNQPTMTEKPEDIFKTELIRLFAKAKEVDEFEYVCALINFNGMGDSRALSHIHESNALLNQITDIIKQTKDIHNATRLFLLLYCHILEMDEFYNIIGNMLRITKGERYAVNLYNSKIPSTTKPNASKPALKPAGKIDKLKSLAKETGFEKLTDVISGLYSSPLRNAFFHSSYSLSEDNFYVISGEGFKFSNGTTTTCVSIKNYILPKTQSTVNMAGTFMNVFHQAPLEYKSNKTVTARLQPGGINVEIQGDPNLGLTGFKTIVSNS